ncbi:MAG TPA: gamma carbonic anhydrase family protein [Prosthecobacter sp.]|nr:gamma carbonic anhydrase family protein [Prosthecobacter sp.]
MNEYPLQQFLLPEAVPSRHASSYVAPGAVVIGAVTLEEDSSVWFTSVLRGDINRIHVGPQSNVQDGSVLHVSDAFPCVLGARVSLGHRAIVHAAEVGDEVLIGMGAIVLDGARIGPRCIVAAGALVPKGMVVPEGSLVLGSPARVVRALSDDEKRANARLALKYVAISRRYREMAGTA